MNKLPCAAWSCATPDYSILDKVFSRRTLLRLLSGVLPDYCREAFSICGVENINDAYGVKFHKLYDCLRKYYPNEYYYKNVLLNRILFGLHSPNTTTALTELVVGSARADVVMINGEAMVYEIKSGLDNYERIGRQIEQYYRAFKYLTIVVPENHASSLLHKFGNFPIGVCTIKKGDHISIVKKAKEYCDALDVDVMFEMLNKKEIEKILLKEYGCLPEIGPFSYYKECRRKICVFDTLKVHRFLKSALKMRNNIDGNIIKMIAPEWKLLAYMMNLKTDQVENLEQIFDRR